ncbi:MAG: ParB/RepB/Spo0J family partition protein [Clostridia bacterium]|nr:ParB/RepB/Spo0J family partition protein [Clostridia bacterium]
MARKSLGRGLDSLFTESPDAGTGQENGVELLQIDLIVPDADQNRKNFDRKALEELADSIKTHGVIQPLIVRPKDGSYQLIAGERRLRAAKMAGLEELPVIVKEVDDRTAAEMALIENLQREDLDPLEEAEGFEKLVERYGVTHAEAGARVGKSREAVSNSLRLLGLPDFVKSLIRTRVISAGHGRALLSLADADTMKEAVKVIVDRNLSVRQTEALVKGALKKPKPPKAQADEVLKAHMNELAQKIAAALGRKCSIEPEADGAGRITLEYFDSDDLEELITNLCGEDVLV